MYWKEKGKKTLSLCLRTSSDCRIPLLVRAFSPATVDPGADPHCPGQRCPGGRPILCPRVPSLPAPSPLATSSAMDAPPHVGLHCRTSETSSLDSWSEGPSCLAVGSCWAPSGRSRGWQARELEVAQGRELRWRLRYGTGGVRAANACAGGLVPPRSSHLVPLRSSAPRRWRPLPRAGSSSTSPYDALLCLL
jgi:hypothetical protein